MISRRKVRKIYAALNIVASVELEGSTAQVYSTIKGYYTPDRSTSPLVIRPRVHVSTGENDNSWTDGLVNSKLDQIRWFANGKNLEDPNEVPTALRGKFSIDRSSGDNRGSLTITANIAPEEVYGLHMEAVFADVRTGSTSGSNVMVRTEPVSLYTTEETIDEYDLSVCHDVNIRYYPMRDRLKEYEWMVEHGKIEASDIVRERCYDGNQYDLNLPIIITKGAGVLTEEFAAWNDCRVRLYAIVDNRKGEITADDCLFVDELTKKNLRVDLRFIPDGTILQVELEANIMGQWKVTGSEQLTFTRVVDKYVCEPTNEGDIDNTKRYRQDSVQCIVNGRLVAHPEAYLDIDWYTTTAGASSVHHDGGEKVKIDLVKAQIGTGEDCWMETTLETRVKSHMAALTVDEAGNVSLTDMNGRVITVDMLEG